MPDHSRPPFYPRPRHIEARRPHGRRSNGIPAGALATLAALAGAALYVQIRSRRAERENPPAGRFVDVDGVRLHFTSHGAGEPVVLLHGNGALVQDFALSGLVDLAAQSYRVIVFDRPGYGYSDRPRDLRWTPEQQAMLFRRAFRTLGIERPVVLGHSWGAQIAVALGMRYPLSVRSLVLLSGYLYPTVRADIVLMSPPAIPVLGDLMRYTVSPLYSRLLWPALIRKLFRPNPVPARFERFPKWMALRPGQLRAAAQESALMIPAAARLSRRYPELAVPAVIMAGAGDRQVTTRHHSARLHRELPNSTLHVVPDVGHMVHHVAPEAVLVAIDEAFDLAGQTAPELSEAGPQIAKAADATDAEAAVIPIRRRASAR